MGTRTSRRTPRRRRRPTPTWVNTSHADHDHHDAAQHDLPGPIRSVSTPAAGMVSIAPMPCGSEQQPGAEGGLVADQQEVLGEQQAGAEERDREQRHRHHGDGEPRVAEQVQVDQRVLGRTANSERKHEQRRSGPARPRPRPAPGRPRRCPRPGSRRRRRGTGPAPARAAACRGSRTSRRATPRRCGSTLPGVEQGAGTDRDVDEEDPVPARDVDQPAAEDRAEDRAEQHRDTEHRHHPADPVGAGGAGHDRHADRHQHAAAEPLEHPERHEHLDAGRRWRTAPSRP